MASKKLQKYCRIIQWIEAKDANLAAAIHDLCMVGALSGGRHGATFLYPAAEVRKTIAAKTYSADAEEAVRLVDAHIISGTVRTGAEFKTAGTRLGIKLEVESSSADAATLKNGAKLKVAKDFQPLRKDNIAVWEVESGEVPLEGPTFEAPKRGRGEYRGGQEEARPAFLGGGLTSRAILATTVENEYSTCMAKDHCATRDPYLAHAVSLLNFLKGAHPTLLVALLPVIDRDPAVTFYLLVEPYKTTGDYLIPDDTLFGPKGWNGAEIYQGAVSEFEGFFESLEKQTGPSAEDRSAGNLVVPYVFRDPAFVRSAVDEVRVDITGEDGRKANKIATPEAVKRAYLALITGNAIGGAQPILPDDTVRLLPGSKKLWQDELRFVLHAALAELRKEPAFNIDSFGTIIRMLREDRPGNDYSRELGLANAEVLQKNVAPQAEFTLLLRFIGATDFLYTPVSAAKIGGQWEGIPVAEGSRQFYDLRTLGSVHNRETGKQAYLSWLRSRGQDAPRPLDAGCIAQIRHYVSVHGSLPPELGLTGVP